MGDYLSTKNLRVDTITGRIAMRVDPGDGHDIEWIDIGHIYDTFDVISSELAWVFDLWRDGQRADHRAEATQSDLTPEHWV